MLKIASTLTDLAMRHIDSSLQLVRSRLARFASRLQLRSMDQSIHNLSEFWAAEGGRITLACRAFRPLDPPPRVVASQRSGATAPARRSLG